jgi:adenosylcobinamide-GDP ribazoletransferase
MRDAVRLAVGTLTAVRVPPPVSMQPPVPGQAMALAPLAGLIPGGLAALTAWCAVAVGLGEGVVAVLVIGTFALVTRGLHLDGLADTADGLAASYDRDKALTVMRRGDTGPTGLAAVVLILLLQCAALTAVLTGAAANGVGPAAAVLVVPAIAVAARVAVPIACVRGVPSARPEGLGATVAGSVGPAAFALALIAAATICSAFGLLSGFSWWAGISAVAAATVTTVAVVHRAVTRFGGITGDVLGAAVEVATAAALLTLAAAR